MKIMRAGVDLAKNVFQGHVVARASSRTPHIAGQAKATVLDEVSRRIPRRFAAKAAPTAGMAP